MKKLLIIIFVLIVGIILTLKYVSKSYVNSDCVIGRISNILNRNNKISLHCSGIEKHNINITWYSEMADARSVIKNGKEVGRIGYEYGSNGFKIRLTNGLEFTVGHFKTNNWDAHKYEFSVFRDSSGYTIKFIADGPDFEWYEQCFDQNGIPNGIVCGQFKNGNYSYIGDYKKGLREGRFIYYNRDGRIRSTLDYQDDELNGFVIDYDEQGGMLWRSEYVNGHEISKN